MFVPTEVPQAEVLEDACNTRFVRSLSVEQRDEEILVAFCLDLG